MSVLHIALAGRMACGSLDALRQRLRSPHELLPIHDIARPDDYAALLERADVLAGWPMTMDLVRRAPNLKLIQNFAAGVDWLRFDDLPPGVRVANTFHHESAISEHILMAMLILSRDPFADQTRLREGNWERSVIWGEPPVLRELRGRSLLLIGLGHIARETAARAQAFGMRVLGASRRPGRIDGFDEVVEFERWQDKLAEADFLAPTCPLTPETEGLIGAAQFERMNPPAYLINITRGRVVDEQALYDALSRRRIAGAAIDVWYQYPAAKLEQRLPSRFPFHELPNVLMTPHNCGWTDRTLEGRVLDVAENINRLAEGRELINVLR